MTKKTINDKDRIRFRKYESGASKRNIKKRHEAMTESLVGSISKLFNAKNERSLPLSQDDNGENDRLRVEDEILEEPISNLVDEVVQVDNEENNRIEDNILEQPMTTDVNIEFEKDVDVNYDPGLWGNMNDSKRIMLVQRGPIKILKDNFPKDNISERRFSSNFYVSILLNGEKQERKWLVYSNELNKVFCFYCKLFKHNTMISSLAGDGNNDWSNLYS
ncbi:zinc finger MYM-type protein 5-like [Impatiens glandulifera]|uniref:zinc finger MYM-type protein 5-like n=1 Tax=Impatiens glandulifera TaxID=253017 RepID=UPI001FB14FDA|nr:zinc finger MYM-type protein 5-like [Impatiens glandulifera]